MGKIRIQNIFPLSPMQKGMLFSFVDGTNSCYEQVMITVLGVLDIYLVEKSYNLLLEKHDALRSIFLYEGLQQPVQVILTGRVNLVRYEDLSTLSEEEKELFIAHYRRNDREMGFDLSRGPLVRLSILKVRADEYKIIFSFNHIVIDGWCIGIIVKDFFEIYCALQKKETVIWNTGYSYRDYINWLENQDKAKAQQYWRQYLDGYAKPALPPGAVKNDSQYLRREKEIIIDEELTKKIAIFARKNLLTVNTFFQTIWGILLQLYNKQNDVVFGSVVSGRPYQIAGIENIVGLFINTIPVRVTASPDTTALELMKSVQKSQLSSLDYSYLPLAEIQMESILKNKLFNHVIAFENYPLDKSIKDFSFTHRAGFEVVNVEIEEETGYDFNLLCWFERTMEIKIVYNANAFIEAEIESIGKQLTALAAKVLMTPNILVNDIDLLPDLSNLQFAKKDDEEYGDFCFD